MNGPSGQVLATAALCLLSGAGLRAQEPPPAAPSPGEVIAAAGADAWRVPAPEDTLYVELESGRVVIELAPDFAPLHVAQMKALAREGFYDGLEFYRVVEGFVAQAGDLDGERPVKTAGRAVVAEFDRPAAGLPFTPLGAADGYAPEVGYVKGLPAARDAAVGRAWPVHCPGAVAMARDVEPDSGGTEFYVVLGQAPRYLDRNLSVFGRVLAGQELLQKLERGAPGLGMIEDPARRGKILRVRVAADVPAGERTALEVMRTEAPSFRALIAARRNRPEAFFVYRPDFIDVCGVPIPVRDAAAAE
jgi:cyclophilin family peptidyl-prolyl cis-trans isomerase